MHEVDQTDVALLTQARAGDARAFGRLFDRHYARVLRHASKLTYERADAEDITAATFFEAWKKRGSIRFVDESIVPWLLATANNLARNTNRSIRRYRDMLDTLPHQADIHEPTAPDLALRAALRLLNLTDQQLLALTLDGYTTAEAAQALGLRDGTARVRLTRARQRLKSELTAASVSVSIKQPLEGRP